MLHTKRLSHRAYNAALKGWLAGQICPAREVCPNPVEKTLRKLYFSGVSRFLRSALQEKSAQTLWRRP